MLSNLLTIISLGLCAVTNVVAAPGAINLGPALVNLRSAANFAILSKTGVSTVPQSKITGAVGVSPISASALTGFALTLDSSGTFSTSRQVTGHILAASYAAPTPAALTAAVADMGTAFNDANGRVGPGFTNLAGGLIGGLVLTPGLYKWTGGVTISGVGVTIAGTASDIFIFQIAGTFNVAANARINLVGGALASNIVWVVTGAVSASPGAHVEGVILAKTSVTLQTGATMNGRILAQTLVALQSATVVG